MTALFAERIASLGSLVKSMGVEECERVFRENNGDEIRRLPSPVGGIGPKVLENLFLPRKGV